jgi:hypothetical protein
MFLHFFQHLYKRQPKLFYLFGSCFILITILNLIKLEVTPFFLYGMFSEKVAIPSTITQKKLLVDGNELRTQHLWVMESLMFEETTSHYLNIKQNQGIDIVQSRVESRYPFLTNSFVYPFLKQHIYNTAADVKTFEQWIKEKCEDVINKKVNRVTIVQDTYQIHPQRTAIKHSNRETLASF